MLAVNPTSGSSLLSAFGALAVLVVTFAEAGLLVVGFLLPGDTLLFPAGVFCAATVGNGPHLTLWQVLLCAAIGSIAGTQFSYYLGRRGGQAALARGGNRRLRAVVGRGEDFLARYGHRKAILLGRFVPMVRSVLGPVAGMLRVPAATFTLWQVIGGLAWTQSMVLLGYWLGAAVPGVENYLLPLVALVVALSLVPVLLQRNRGNRASARQKAPAEHPDRPPTDDRTGEQTGERAGEQVGERTGGSTPSGLGRRGGRGDRS
ncbi:DedA family protein [Streptacidiphilus sp. P02-A3a]|nr:DedA family protein [Streptacidiphilus sp. P02-A3a]QMU73833.1 DedA family protein [Streptacidiphilus sp. P02-A3a]